MRRFCVFGVLFACSALPMSYQSAAWAESQTITFDNLSAPNFTPYTGSIEGDFTVTPTAGSWFFAQMNGNPIPDIFSNSTQSSVEVVENLDGLFTFSSVELDDASSGGFDFLIEGYRNGLITFSIGGPYPGGQFTAINNPNPGIVIDALLISIDSNTSSYNIDNIVVDTIPEPSTGILLLVGVLSALRRFGYQSTDPLV